MFPKLPSKRALAVPRILPNVSKKGLVSNPWSTRKPASESDTRHSMFKKSLIHFYHSLDVPLHPFEGLVAMFTSLKHKQKFTIMKTAKLVTLLVILSLFLCMAALAQDAKETKNKKEKTMESKTMNTYVIEREIPDAGKLSAADLQGISQKSCSVLKELGPDIQWVQSYVAGNKIYCIYKAENEEILRTHAAKGGFPINSVSKLTTIISPATATAPLAEIIK